MAFAREHFEKPFSKLSKATRKKDVLEDPERVHKLRTNTRRVEAILGAVDMIPARKKKQLLRDLKRVRRAAGAVRDRDVLTAKAADVVVDGERNCQIRLLHELGMERAKAAGKLRKQLKSGGKEIRAGLKLGRQGARRLVVWGGEEYERMAAARALSLSGGLRKFAAIDRRNLHAFRKEAKQLRYVLQMAEPADQRMLEGLRAMQDGIGEWHDWEELLGIGKKVLKHGRGCGLLRELQLHADSSFDEALRVANKTRRELLGGKGGPAELRIMKAAEKLAA